jgi:hypothetical protein
MKKNEAADVFLAPDSAAVNNTIIEDSNNG